METTITFITYMIIVLMVGVYASRRTYDLSDFVLGGRSLSGPIAALGAGASDMSGWLLLGLPGAAYATGVNQIYMAMGLVIGAWMNWQFVARRLRVYTEQANNALTIPAYLDNRFYDDTRVLRVVTALAVLLFFTLYAAAGFVGGATLFQNSFHISYHTSLLISACVILSYTAIGGFLAVSWLDFFQGTLMFLALLAVPVVAISHLGGWHATLNDIAAVNPRLLDATSDFTWIGTISLLAWGLGYFGQPHILVRFMAAKSEKVIPQASFICTTWMSIALYGAIFTGLVGAAQFHNLANPETVFLQFADTLFNPWIAGILLAAVLSAIMSTIAAQLLASSSALTEDLYRNFVRPSAKRRELLWISRLTVLLIALTAITIAYNPESSVLVLVSHAWAGLGASFGPVILYSLYWRRMTYKGAIAGIISGAVAVMICLYGKQLHIGFFEIYEIIPSFILSALMIPVVSLLDKPPKQEIMSDFEKVQQLL